MGKCKNCENQKQNVPLGSVDLMKNNKQVESTLEIPKETRINEILNGLSLTTNERSYLSRKIKELIEYYEK